MRLVHGLLLALVGIGMAAAASAQTDPWAEAPRKPGLVQTVSPKLNEEAWFVPGAGEAAADDIEAVVRHVRTLPMVRKDRVLLIGHSAGGFGVVALAGRNLDGVIGVINFAGGRGAHQGPSGRDNCAPDRLVAATRGFGGGARTPSLRLYAENDSYIGPVLSQRLAEAYKAGGGNVDYRLLPAFKNEGHEVFGSADGRALWTGPVGEFLARLE